jgi:hypothetical protein
VRQLENDRATAQLPARVEPLIREAERVQRVFDGATTGSGCEGPGAGQAGEAGRPALRLCKVVAQSPSAAEQDFKNEVEKELTGRETEPGEIIYFKLYQSQTPVMEKAIDPEATAWKRSVRTSWLGQTWITEIRRRSCSP